MLKKKEILIVLLIIAAVSACYFPVIKDLGSTVISEDDWYGNYYYAGIARETILGYHQLPLRTPYLGGGYPSIAHPFDFSFSPFLPLILFFGEVAGLRIAVFLIFVAASLGMFYLTRRVLKYNIIGSVFSVFAFSFCNWGSYELTDGNIQKIFYYLLPWLFAFIIKSKEDKRFIVLSCFSLSPFVMNSGLSLIPVLLALFLFCALNSISMDKRKVKFEPSWLKIFAAVFFLSCLLYSVKIIPMYKLYLSRVGFIHLPYEDYYSRVSVATKAFGSSLDLGRLWASLFDKSFLGYSSMYLGYVPVIIALFSIFIFRKENLRWLALLVIFTLIQFGSNSPVDIFKIIWQVIPGSHGIWRLDKYFGFFIPFFVSLIAGRFFLIANGRKKLYFLIIPAVIFSSVDIYLNNRALLGNMVYEKMPSFKKYGTFFQVKIEDALISRQWLGFSDTKDTRSYQPFWLLLRQNIGVVNFNWAGNIKLSQGACPRYILPVGKLKGEVVYVKGFEELPKDPGKAVDLITAGKENPSYKAEAFFLNSANKAELRYFSPDIIELDIDVRDPDTLIINQNFHGSWRVTGGRLVNRDGLLAAEIKEPGHYKVRFKYIPLDFYAGLIISLTMFFALSKYLLIIKTKKER